MRRIVIFSAVFLLMIIMLSGCTGGESGSGSKANPETAINRVLDNFEKVMVTKDMTGFRDIFADDVYMYRSTDVINYTFLSLATTFFFR